MLFYWIFCFALGSSSFWYRHTFKHFVHALFLAGFFALHMFCPWHQAILIPSHLFHLFIVIFQAFPQFAIDTPLLPKFCFPGLFPLSHILSPRHWAFSHFHWIFCLTYFEPEVFPNHDSVTPFYHFLHNIFHSWVDLTLPWNAQTRWLWYKPVFMKSWFCLMGSQWFYVWHIAFYIMRRSLSQLNLFSFYIVSSFHQLDDQATLFKSKEPFA